MAERGGVAGGLARVGRQTLELGRSVMNTALGRGRGPSRGQVSRGDAAFPMLTGPHERLADAQWLGPYTPTSVPHSIHKLMRRDAQIGLGLAALKSPFFGIEYRVESGHPAARALVKKVLLDSKHFDSLKWTCLNSLDFGSQSHEIVWELADVMLQIDDELAPRMMSQAFVLRKIKDLDPDRVQVLVNNLDDMVGLRVNGFGERDGFVPADKMLHAVNQFEFSNYLGESILDRVYQPWHWGNVQYLLLNRYLEGRGNPPLIGRAPNEVRYDESLPRDGQTPLHCLDVLNKQMVSLRSGGACALPFEVDENGNLKWAIEVLQDSGRTETFLGAINHYNAMKLRGIFVPERIATQDTQVGSFAMVKEHVDVFFGMLEVIKRRTLLAPINRLAELLTRVNFGRGVEAPVVTASELNRFKSELLGQIVTQLMELPTTFPDGSVFNGSELVDVERTLEAANVPMRPMREILRARSKAPGAPALAAPAAGPKALPGPAPGAVAPPS